MQTVDITKPVFELVKDDPELKEALIEIGFTPISSDKMLNTVGRVISPKDGIKQIGITRDRLIEELEAKGYEAKE